MVKYKLKPASAAVLSSALVLSSLTGFSATADAATKVKNVTSSAKIKKGKLVKKSDGKIIKGYASYKSVIYKDGKKFKGLLNKRYYNNGKKATGLYKSKYYKNGLLGTGTYKNNYYKKGSLFTGKLKGVYYQKGKIFTGITSKGNYYKKGKLGTGSYKGFYYSVGKKFTGLTSKGVYYKNGKLGNGIYKDILYKSGKPFNGTLKDEVYINGKVDSNKTANLVFTNAKTAFTKYEASFNTAQKNVEDLADLAKKAGVTTSKAASLQVKSAQDIQDFIAKYSNTDFTTLTEAQLETFKAELGKHTAEANKNLEEASKLVQTSTISLLNAIAVMKTFATEVQKAEFTKLATQANIVIHALKEAGADTSKLEEALKDTEIKVPEIETPGGGDTPGTGEENPGTGEENPGTGEGNNGGSNNGGGNETQDAITKAIAAAETAVKALADEPTQEKIDAATAAVAALTALKSDYDVSAFNTAIENAKQVIADAKALAAATTAVNALFSDDNKTTLADSVVEATITESQNLVKALKDSDQKTALEAKLTEATKQLKDALAKLNEGLSTEGQIVIAQPNKNIDDAFSFQMKGIMIDPETGLPTQGTPEASTLTLENVNQVLSTILGNGAGIEATSEHKHGFSIFTVSPKTISVEDFQKLDSNKNNAYLITVNNKTTASKSSIAYKILFQVTGGKVVTKFVESSVKDDHFSIEAATTAVNALFSDDNKTTLADSVVEATITESQNLVKALKDSDQKTALEEKLTSATTQLKDAITKLNNGVQTDGTVAVKGTKLNKDEIFTYRMAGIELKNGTVSYEQGTQKEAKTLTPSQVNEALVKTLIAKGDQTINEGDQPFGLEKKEKHGFTILQPTFNLTVAQYKLLDQNGNNAYLITVTKPVAGDKLHKILVQFTGSKAVSTFVDKLDSDENYTILLVEKGIQDLFTDSNKTTLKEGVSQETIQKLTDITITITKNTEKAKEFNASLKRAADLLKVTELQNELDAVTDKTTVEQFSALTSKVDALDEIAKGKLKLDSFNSYKALAEAKLATEGTFNLTSDITITEAVHLKEKVILDGGNHTVTVASTALKDNLSGVGLSGTATLQNITVQGQGSTKWADNLVEIIGGKGTNATLENVTIKDGYQAGLLVQTDTNLTVKDSLTLNNNLWGGGEVHSTATLTFAEGATFSYTPAGNTPPFWIDAMVENAKNIIGADSFLNAPETGKGNDNKQTFYTLKTQ